MTSFLVTRKKLEKSGPGGGRKEELLEERAKVQNRITNVPTVTDD